MKKAFLVIGCPGSGKSWVCNQVKHLFTYVPHDLFIGEAGAQYIRAIKRASSKAVRPLLIETPFSVSQIVDPLLKENFEIEPITIIEEHKVISDRYKNREGRAIIPGHLTRQETYKKRAIENKSFMGTTTEAVSYLLKKIKEWESSNG